MNSVLENRVISNSDRGGTNKGGAVPYWRISADCNISEDGGIGGNKIGLLKLRLFSLIGQFSETGSESIFADELSFDIVSDLVELFACSSEGGAD